MSGKYLFGKIDNKILIGTGLNIASEILGGFLIVEVMIPQKV